MSFFQIAGKTQLPKRLIVGKNRAVGKVLAGKSVIFAVLYTYTCTSGLVISLAPPDHPGGGADHPRGRGFVGVHLPPQRRLHPGSDRDLPLSGYGEIKILYQ